MQIAYLTLSNSRGLEVRQVYFLQEKFAYIKKKL